MTNLHLVCPHCHGVNRIETSRLVDSPNCGKCKGSLFDAQPVELTDKVFYQHISKNDIPVVVDFWAPWCAPCKMMVPEFKQAAELLEPKVRFAKIDTENNQQTAAQFSIRSIPTMILFKGGKSVAQQAGAMSATQIKDWVLENI